MFRKNDFLPREQVVKNCIAFWRDKPGAEDILEMLINEEPKKIPRKKARKRKLFKEIAILYSRNNGNSTNDKKRRSNAFIVRNIGKLIEMSF